MNVWLAGTTGRTLQLGRSAMRSARSACCATARAGDRTIADTSVPTSSRRSTRDLRSRGSRGSSADSPTRMYPLTRNFMFMYCSCCAVSRCLVFASLLLFMFWLWFNWLIPINNTCIPPSSPLWRTARRRPQRRRRRSAVTGVVWMWCTVAMVEVITHNPSITVNTHTHTRTHIRVCISSKLANGYSHTHTHTYILYFLTIKFIGNILIGFTNQIKVSASLLPQLQSALLHHVPAQVSAGLRLSPVRCGAPCLQSQLQVKAYRISAN